MKNKILIISIIVIVLLVIAGGLTFAYMTTDFLKTDEQLFYKYIGVALENIESFKSQELTDYLNKTKTSPYENSGKLTVNVDIPEEMQSQYPNIDLVNGVNIAYTGKVDNKNQKVEQSIQLNYSNDVSLPIEYRQTDNLYGITSGTILKKYIAVRNENLQALSEKLGISEEIPNQINANKENISEEKINEEIEIFKNIIKNNITKENFSKEENNNFVLSLTEQQTKNITIQMIQEVKNFSFITNEQKDMVNDLLVEVNESSATTKIAAKIIVDKNGTIKVKLEDNVNINIQIKEDNITITSTSEENADNVTAILKKQGSGSDVTYRVDFLVSNNEQDANVYLESSFVGLVSNSPKENYELGISIGTEEQTVSYKYNLDTSKNFVNSVDVRTISDSNSLIVNDASEEYLNLISAAVILKLAEVNNTQMTALGLSGDTNLLIYTTPLGMIMPLKNEQAPEQTTP